MPGIRRTVYLLAAWLFGLYSGSIVWVSTSTDRRHHPLSRPPQVALDWEVTEASLRRRAQSKRKHSGSGSTSVCGQLFPDQGGIPAALDTWTSSLTDIHVASQLLPNDPKYVFSGFTRQLLNMVTPRLPSAVTFLPNSQWETVERLLQKLVAHYEFATSRENDKGAPPDPIRLVILGGSVLVGRNCRRIVKDLGLQLRLPNRECTYSHRLEQFVNRYWSTFLLDNHNLTSIDHPHPLLQVTKIAMGGTNTATGSRILEYNLLPEAARDPDVIINAYSTNDMHVLTVQEALQSNVTLPILLLDMIQDFCRTVLQRRPCNRPTPLLIHLDDYLGNEQRKLLEIADLSRTVSALSSYYGFAAFSYANMVRRLVLSDTHESWFSPDGWWPSHSASRMEREIHPGMGMHIAMVWVIVYGFLDVATTFCSGPELFRRLDTHDDVRTPLQEKQSAQVPGRPNRPPRALPPPLTVHSRLDDISETWKVQSEQQDRQLEAIDCTTEPIDKCIFSWVSGLSLQQNDKAYVEALFQSHLVNDGQWALSDDGDKLGWVPTKIGAYATLEFLNVKQPINTVTFFTLKSYGDKWENSRLKVQVESKTRSSPWRDETTHEFVGFHSKTTSEVYVEKIPVKVEIGGSLRFGYSLSEGMTFKIMGLAVCT